MDAPGFVGPGSPGGGPLPTHFMLSGAVNPFGKRVFSSNFAFTHTASLTFAPVRSAPHRFVLSMLAFVRSALRNEAPEQSELLRFVSASAASSKRADTNFE